MAAAARGADLNLNYILSAEFKGISDFRSYSILNSLEAINRRLLGFVNYLGEAW